MVIEDMDEDEYHAHPALSATGAKLLAQPGGPAKYHWQQLHPAKPKKAYDLGHAVHGMVLGVGAPVVPIPEELLASNGAASTAAAKQFIVDVRADGQIPIKLAEYEQVTAMAKAVMGHPLARRLLEAAKLCEVSLFRKDERTGADLRARFDAVGKSALVDLKTTISADPAEFTTSARKLGYHIQSAWYEDMAQAHDLTDQPLRFVNVEKTEPYLVSVCVIDETDRLIAREQIARAIDAWLTGTETGEWPGYGDKEHTIAFPGWWRDQHDTAITREIEDEFEAYLASRTKGQPT